MNDEQFKRYVEQGPKEQRAERAVAAALFWPEHPLKTRTFEEIKREVEAEQECEKLTR